MRSTPSWLARAVLTHLVRHETLTGDLLEQYALRPSRLWLWRQIAVALALRAWRRPVFAPETSALVLALDPHPHPASRPGTPYVPLPPVRINMSGIPVDGIGGLGFVAVAVLITIVMPAAWWLFVSGLTGGIILGTALVLRRRRTGLSGSGGRPGGLFEQLEAQETSTGARGASGSTGAGGARNELTRVISFDYVPGCEPRPTCTGFSEP
jgi:hypothetical protein